MALPDFTEGAYHPTVTADARSSTQKHNIGVVTQVFPYLLEQIRSFPQTQQAVSLPGLQLLGNTSGDHFRLTYHPPEVDDTTTTFSITLDHDESPLPLGQYRYKLTENNDSVNVCATVEVAPHAQGNGYGTALLLHDVDMIHTFLIAHGYNERDVAIYVSIVDGANGYHGLEYLNPYYSRDMWTSWVIGQNLIGKHYTTDPTVMRRYPLSPIVSAVYVIKDPARGIDNLSRYC